MWGRKYVMLGLLAEYDRTGDKSVLSAIEKHAGYIMQNYGKEKKSTAVEADIAAVKSFLDAHKEAEAMT